MKNLIAFSALLLLCAVMGFPAFAQESTPEATPESTAEPILYTQVRFGHYANDVPNVDIYLNGTRLMGNVPFGNMTNYFMVEAAVYEVLVIEVGDAPTEANAILPVFNTVLMPERSYSLALIGGEAASTPEATDAPSMRIVALDETSLYDVNVNSNMAHVIVLPALDDYSGVRVAFDGQPQGASAIPFGDYLAVNHAAGDVAFKVEVMREAEIAWQVENDLELEGNVLYFIVLTGTRENPQLFLQVSGTHSIAQYLKNSRDFTIIYSILESANLLDALEHDSPFTVFAPTNATFEAWLSAQAFGYADLLADSELLEQVAHYHVARGMLFSSGISSTLLIPMIGGEDIAVTSEGGEFYLNEGVNLTTMDLLMANGVIHVVGEVLNSPVGE